MNLTRTISFECFNNKNLKKRVSKILKKLIHDESQVFSSLKKSYENSYNSKLIKKLKKYSEIKLIGMGGSSLGARAIYKFLINRIKKKIRFLDNLNEISIKEKLKRNSLNIIISKSGNTLETITNVNLFTKKSQKNVYITQKKNSYLNNLAKKIKAEMITHNNYIGGRYSVLSEVGMLPAELMGLNPLKFKQYNNLIKNKNFIKSLISNVSNILDLANNKKTNSIILNYDNNSSDLFAWYQQLVAESLGKKGKGFLPIISNMPRDNHSLMQFYLDGPQKNFYTFFFVKEKSSKKINNKELLNEYFYIKNKNINDIKLAQFNATKNVFKKKIFL